LLFNIKLFFFKKKQFANGKLHFTEKDEVSDSVSDNNDDTQDENKKRKRKRNDDGEISRKKGRLSGDGEESEVNNESDDNANSINFYKMEDYEKMSDTVIRELFLPHFTTPRQTYIPVPPEHPMDCLARIGLVGLKWFVLHPDSEGKWSPGQVLDMVQTIEKLYPNLKKKKFNFDMERWDEIKEFLEITADKRRFVKVW